MSKDEALKLALEALTATMATHGFREHIEEAQDEAIKALEEALANHCEDNLDMVKQEQNEPVGVTYKEVADAMNSLMMGDSTQLQLAENLGNKKLYTTPQPKQEQGEPVAWAMLHDNGAFIDAICPEEHAKGEGEYTHPLYTTPQQRTWVGLTDEEIDECDWGQSERDHARAIEAKLKEKNT